MDVAGDRGRADEGDRLDVRVLQETVHGHLVAVHDVEDTVRQAGLGEQFGDPVRGRRVLLARLEHEGVAARDGDGEHPHRHHRREVERRDAGDHAERLPDRGHVHTGGDLRRQLALQLDGDPAGKVDDLQAARDLAERVGVHLAVLGGDQRGDLVAVRVQQRPELEEDRGPLGQRGLTPGQVRLLGGGDRGVHLVDGGEGDLGGDLSRRRVRHRPVRARGAFGGLAADPVVDDVRHDRELLHRWRRRVETCRWSSSRAVTGDGRGAVRGPRVTARDLRVTVTAWVHPSRRALRARPTLCMPFGRPSGHVGQCRPVGGRGNLRRGGGTSGESALAPRSCQGGAAVPRRRRSVGEPASAGACSGPRPIGSCAIASPFVPPWCLPRFLAPRVRPVNVLSGHSDDVVRTVVRTPLPVPRDARRVNAPRLNSGGRLRGTRVTKGPAPSRMSRAHGASVTSGNGP